MAVRTVRCSALCARALGSRAWPPAAAPARLSIVGGGKMAEALIGGAIDAGISPQAIFVSDTLPSRLAHLAKTFGVKTTADNAEVVADSEVAILAVKPQFTTEALLSIRATLPKSSVLVSIAAGCTIDTISRTTGSNNIVRCMPNTPGMPSACTRS
jgi:pyrroline-5-carboxylate reductase